MVGDVVWAPFTFTDLTQSKLRPVLVLADVRDGNQHDWVVCEVTSGRAIHAREIPLAQSDFRTGGLNRNSRARPDRLTTLEESVFLRTIGRLTDAKLAEVLAAVRGLF